MDYTMAGFFLPYRDGESRRISCRMPFPFCGREKANTSCKVPAVMQRGRRTGSPFHAYRTENL